MLQRPKNLINMKKELNNEQMQTLTGGSACSGNPVEAALCFAEDCIVVGLTNHIISVVVNGAPLSYSCNL